MGEHKGYVVALVFLLIFALPVTLMFAKDSIEQHAFMKMTSELSVIVKEEGGVTNNVSSLVNEMEQKGYDIRFVSASGQEVRGKVPYGTTITAYYNYTYKTFIIGEREFKNVNKIQVLKR